MKTKSEFFKENWLVALLMNLPYFGIISIAFSPLIDNPLTFWLVVIFGYIFLSLSSIKDWYLEHQIDYLIEKTKNLN